MKGRKKFDYPPGVQQGIALHRAIDMFTDTHPATKKAKEIFRPHYRLYSGAFVDVVYDHFLAIDKGEFSQEQLFEFSQKVYSILAQHERLLPERFAGIFPYMKQQNWLYNYRTRWGTEKSIGGLVRRAAYLTDGSEAYRLFETHYQLLQEYFRQFWKDVKPFAREQFEMLIKSGRNA